MRIRLVFFLISTCWIASWPAFGSMNARVDRIPCQADASRIVAQQLQEDEWRITVEVAELVGVDVATTEGDFTRLTIPGFHASRTEGAPELPQMNRLIVIPAGTDARIEITDRRSRWIDLEDFGIDRPLMPAQPSMPKDADPRAWPFVYDRAAYEVDRVERPLARIVPLGRLRAAEVGRLEISPVVYDPLSNRLRVTESIELRVVFESSAGGAGKSNILNPALYSPFFDHLYRRIIGGKGIQDDYPDLVGDVVTMVIVTPPMFEAQLQEFVRWKTERGFHVIVGSIGSPEVGTTAASIQAYVHDLYTNPPAGRPAPSFLLLAGDVEQVPTFTEGGNATDRPYCAVDGDLVPDIYYGRLSATNPTQLQAILDKTLMYERLTMPDPSYLGEACLIAGMDSYWSPTHANGQVNYGTSNYFNLTQGISCHSYLYPASGGSATQILADVSAGVAVVNYTAHGSATSWIDPRFTQADVNGLTNSGRYCLAIGNCCSTSEFAVGECFAETWLRAPDKGAIGYIGGSNSTYWNEDFWWAVGACAPGDISANPTFAGTGMGAYDGLFHTHDESEALHYVTNAAIMFCGNLAVMEAGSSYSEYYWNIYNLMGDPSLATYLGMPQPNPVVHPGEIYAAAAAMIVEAVPGSYVGLTQGGVLVGAGTVGAGGSLELNFLQSPLSSELPLHLVVTAQNREPYVADIGVVVPATISIVPAVIPVGVETDLTVTVLDADGITPLVGIEIWAEGLAYGIPPVATDAAGRAVITVDYPYGPSVDIAGRDPAESYRLFTLPVAVTAAPLTDPDLTVTTDVGLSDAFALHLPGTLQATVQQAGHTLYAKLPDGSSLTTGDLDLELTPSEIGEIEGIIAVSGHDLYVESFDVIEAHGSLSGTVVCDGDPVPGVTVCGYDSGMQPVFEVVSDGTGAFVLVEEILVADYMVTVSHFGYQPYESAYFVNYGANVLTVQLQASPVGVLAGSVIDTASVPLAATLRLYRADTNELFTEVTTDPADGSFTTGPLPYFDYRVNVRAWRCVPLDIELSVEDPTVEKHFVLEPTNGDLLVIDDSEWFAQSEDKYHGKNEVLVTSGYAAPGRKAAADLVSDLENLGYYVTVEAIGSTDPASWGGYDLLLVSCGDNTSPMANSVVRTALENHVADGGHLLIEGGEVGYDAVTWPGYPTFAADVLHITGWNHDESGDVVPVDPSHRLLSFPNAITGPIAMEYNGYGDHDGLNLAAGADMVATWSDHPGEASIIAFDTNPSPDGGQIVYFAFNWSVADSLARGQLLQNSVIWLTTYEFGDCSVSGSVSLLGQSDHSGVLVQALPGGEGVLTGPDGLFELTGLHAGTQRILASKEGWSVDVAEVTLAPGECLTGLDLLLTATVTAQECRAPQLSIPDNTPAGISDTITLMPEGPVCDVEVFLDITHPFIGDLIVTLTSPDGTEVVLSDRSGGAADSLVGWFPVEITPADDLAILLGERIHGDWILTVSDHANYDVGRLDAWCLRVVHGSGAVTVPEDATPRALAIRGNHPNPFNPVTHVQFELPRALRVELAVYDLSGRRVATLVRERLEAGRHEVAWAGRDATGRKVASGTYFCRLDADGRSLVHKMLLVK